jgi:hypothetical protein
VWQLYVIYIFEEIRSLPFIYNEILRKNSNKTEDKFPKYPLKLLFGQEKKHNMLIGLFHLNQSETASQQVRVSHH